MYSGYKSPTSVNVWWIWGWNLVHAALMNQEVSPDLDTCVQEVLREEIRLQSQHTIKDDTKAFVAPSFQNATFLTTRGQKTLYYGCKGFGLLVRNCKKKNFCKYCKWTSHIFLSPIDVRRMISHLINWNRPRLLFNVSSSWMRLPALHSIITFDFIIIHFSYSQAITEPYWQDAMMREPLAFEAKRTWVLVPQPVSVFIIVSMCTYSI